MGANSQIEGARSISGEAYQRAFHIVKQTRPANVSGRVARDEDIVGSGLAKPGQKQA